MEIFNKYQNNELKYIIELIHILITKDKITMTQMSSLSKEMSIQNDDEIKRFLLHMGVLVQDKKNKTVFYPSGWLRDIGILLDANELDYLSTILKDMVTDLFLEKKTQDKIREMLPLDGFEYDAFIRLIQPKERNIEVDIESFRRLLQAIGRQCDIRYSYKTNHIKQISTAEAAPYRIEYSAYDKRFWVLLYSYEEKRSIKAKLNNLHDIEILGSRSVTEAEIEKALKQKESEQLLILQVIDQRNALERCFLMFDNYHRVETQRLAPDKYRIVMKYFEFEQQEIVKKLLYLGQFVIVEQPTVIKEEVIKRIKATLNNYN